MKKNFKNIAEIAMCVLGVLSTSSCSKDEFFGLNEYESLDYSKKIEIALSQEYTDYAVACFKIVDAMNLLSDTTANRNIGEIDGKTIYYVESGEPIMDLLEILKKKYPELIYADKPDLDEIQRIANSKNITLRKLAGSKTSTKNDGSYQESEYYIGYLNCAKSNLWTDNLFVTDATIGHWWLHSWWAQEQDDAVSSAIWSASEFGYQLGSGGLVFSDGSAVSIAGVGEWPSLINEISFAESDFLIVPYSDISFGAALYIAYGITGGGGRSHYFIRNNGEVLGFVY